MDNNERLLAQLEVITSHQATQIDDHETRIRTLEEVSNIVEQISVNVEKQGTNIDKLANAIEMLQGTQNQMNIKMKEAELKAEYSTYVKIKNLLGHINWEKILILLASGTGIATVFKFIFDIIK